MSMCTLNLMRDFSEDVFALRQFISYKGPVQAMDIQNDKVYRLSYSQHLNVNSKRTD